MRTYYKIKDEKLQYDINKEAAKLSALPSGKIDKHEFFTGRYMLPSDQDIIIEQTKFAYSSLGKVCEKQLKTIKMKTVEALKALNQKKIKNLTFPQNNEK